MEILRKRELNTLEERLSVTPVVALLGPRQCGKTTLAKQYANRLTGTQVHHLDCEDPRVISRLENPMMALESLAGLVIIDEIQRRPDLFSVLRVLVDGDQARRFLILGSASRDLLAQGPETLAGRISFVELAGFSIHDMEPTEYRQLWIRGGFPRSYLAKSESASAQWREDFIRTFLERDIPQLGIRVPSSQLRRFWTMLSHYHGQVLNASEIGRSMNIADTTVRHYLDILTGTFLVRQLQPWSYNTKKRLVKRPKIYFRDSGLLHTLLSIRQEQELINHPRLGASWEGFALEQVLRHLQLREEEAFFWSLHSGGELDLLFRAKGKLWGVAFKYTDAPTIGRSMHSALRELGLAHLWVIYPGEETYPLDYSITVAGLNSLEKIFIK
jgi:predicted AAA+ superfamily ATPase